MFIAVLLSVKFWPIAWNCTERKQFHFFHRREIYSNLIENCSNGLYFECDVRNCLRVCKSQPSTIIPQNVMI